MPRRSHAVPLAAAAVVVLLAVLATLQYRWAGELGTAEMERLKTVAKGRTEALARDFDLEVTRASSGLSLGGEALASGDASAFAERYEAWRADAAFPGLVREVLRVDRERDAVALSRYDPLARRFVPAEWTRELEPLRERLAFMERGFGPPGMGGRPGERGRAPDRPPGPPARPPGPIVDEIPAVILFGEGPGRRFEPFGPRPLLVAVLDMDAVTGQVLPALAARHFGGPDGLDYDLDVVRQANRGSVVWRSRADAPRVSSPDAAAGLLDLRFEELGGPQGRRFAGMRAHTEDTGAWRLVASHRAGSLEQVVASARRRNLAVGFGILTLVGASVALMLVSALRARRLAERQMEFVAAVSHELRTPVAAICSTSENLADGVVSEPAQVRAYGAVLRDEGRRLGDMIERVLEFAGAARARPRLLREEVDAATLVDDALRPFAAEIERRGVALVREVAPGLRLQADALALKRVLHNLVENALKYAAGGRFLAVRAAPEDDGRVRVSVEDHGEGIPAAELSQVFEPFFRGSRARADQVRGFGLGLALSRLVVEAHGGRIDVARTPGGGTTFVLRLPRAGPAARPAALPDALANPDR